MKGRRVEGEVSGRRERRNRKKRERASLLATKLIFHLFLFAVVTTVPFERDFHFADKTPDEKADISR